MASHSAQYDQPRRSHEAQKYLKLIASSALYREQAAKAWRAKSSESSTSLSEFCSFSFETMLVVAERQRRNVSAVLSRLHMEMQRDSLAAELSSAEAFIGASLAGRKQSHGSLSSRPDQATQQCADLLCLLFFPCIHCLQIIQLGILSRIGRDLLHVFTNELPKLFWIERTAVVQQMITFPVKSHAVLLPVSPFPCPAINEGANGMSHICRALTKKSHFADHVVREYMRQLSRSHEHSQRPSPPRDRLGMPVVHGLFAQHRSMTSEKTYHRNLARGRSVHHNRIRR